MKVKDEPCVGHHDFTNYYASGRCGKDFCDGWYEYNCRICGWFISDCRCGYCIGAGKIPWQKQENIYKKQLLKIQKQLVQNG